MSFLNWLTSTIGTTVVLGLAVFLTRTFIIEKITALVKHKYDKELETHKANLKKDYDVQIEKLKAELAQQHFQFSHVFKKTEEIIADTYRKLLAIKQALERYTILSKHNESFRKNLMDEFWVIINGFKEFFEPNKIYIPKRTVKQIEAFTTRAAAASIQYHRALEEAKSPNRTPETYGTLFNDFIKNENELPRLLELLEDDFQKILGFPMDETKK